ncbi:AMP-binding protein [Micromonospora olivasterospora]|uniref:Crotonobetaine/carnitine-CoA ligase n=1 Tax=Micromonospora olivasterospora TaxID=1880 RepID=A0A562I2Q3_MICOL|nr:AMP-binding protein [Micromonospora olivasterospora]TWH65329.1 crotonobetaine/carnitine-CoA ligase [Micromonospora olivasterospora]
MNDPKDAGASHDFEDFTLTSLLRRQVDERPGFSAVRDEACEFTYADLWTSAAKLAGGLSSLGVAEGDHVLLMLDNSADYALAVIAVNFLGGVSVPVNTMHKGTILEHVIRDSGATKAIVEANHFDTFLVACAEPMKTIVVRGDLGATPAIPATRLATFAEVAAAEAVVPLERKVWDTLLIGYTSGTTGSSKGVKLSNGYALTVSHPVELQKVTWSDPVFYVVCPMFHITGLAGGLFAAITAGGTTHIASRFSASTFAEDATRAGATATTLVGTMADFLLRQPPKPSDADCSLRSVAMIPVHPRVEEFADRFGVEVRTSFGSTESNAILTVDDREGIARRSCGKPRRGFDVRIVDEHDMEVPPGTVGEVIARSDRPWLIGGEYLGNVEANARAWRNGWFHTGDLLKRDADGYHYFVDRTKDAIRRRGENISSVEVEREVLAHPEVEVCAAVAVDAEHMEQEVKIYVVRRAGSTLTEEVLVKFLIDRMPRYSVPRYVKFVEDLPRTATAKIRKDLLRKESNDDVWDRETAGVQVPR